MESMREWDSCQSDSSLLDDESRAETKVQGIVQNLVGSEGQHTFNVMSMAVGGRDWGDAPRVYSSGLPA
jgi:hypothetical protein